MTTKQAKSKGFSVNDSHGEGITDMSHFSITHSKDKGLIQAPTHDDLAQVTFIGDSADADAANTSYIIDHIPNLEDDTINTDMPNAFGITNYEETTIFPESQRSVTRRYGHR